MNDPTTLQAAIAELVAFDYKPNTAAWVAKVSGAPTEVIAGAIVMWGTGGNAMLGAPDPAAPRREAAMAILQARFATESGRQTRQLIWLTWVIAVLTAVMLAAVVAQLLTPIPTHAELMSMPRPK